MAEEKRCENCRKLFGPKRWSTGIKEYPGQFKKRRYCSRICAAIRNAAERKATIDAEMRA